MSNEWQPIDTAPKDGTQIIGYEPQDSIYGGVIGIQWIPQTSKMYFGSEIKLGGYWAKSVHTQVVLKPTHWLPLPELPKQ